MEEGPPAIQPSIIDLDRTNVRMAKPGLGMSASCTKALVAAVVRSPCTPKPTTSGFEPSIIHWRAWVTFKQGYGFGRIGPVPQGRTVSICQGCMLRNRTVEKERRIEEWNAQWMVIAGRAVCTGCMESQALEDCEGPFAHADACAASDQESKHPWCALHHILDTARG